MLQTEYLRSLNSNYERILLDRKPEERKYQYCILSRGGIKGLLSCSLRYINGLSYLYYDISSKQNIVQLYDKRPMNRKWIKDFFWSVKEIQLELGRFLLDEQNILWYPQQVFQDLESNIFSFLYVPYYEGNNGFGQLLEYFVEHIDYEDEILVECIYKMYEQFEKAGSVYLQEQIFEDVKMLDGLCQKHRDELPEKGTVDVYKEENKEKERLVEKSIVEKNSKEKNSKEKNSIEKNIIEEKIKAQDDTEKESWQISDASKNGLEKRDKKGILSLFEGKKKKERVLRDDYEQAMQHAMNGYAVAESPAFEEEEWGKTVYVEDAFLSKPIVHHLCTPEGRVVAQLDKATLTIGKKKEEVDLVLEDMSVSRMHARILKENDELYLEDLNSTNGTFKNGLRMQPYEKRKLEAGDEIRFGKKTFTFC